MTTCCSKDIITAVCQCDNLLQQGHNAMFFLLLCHLSFIHLITYIGMLENVFFTFIRLMFQNICISFIIDIYIAYLQFMQFDLD